MSKEKEYETLSLEIIEQWSQKELVNIVLRQQKIIEKLLLEIEKLKDKQPSNSYTPSKPPSTDLIQKSEKAFIRIKKGRRGPKGSLSGQPGHVGKTRKRFGRVDRYEISYPSVCENCGGTQLSDPIGVQKQQVGCERGKTN